MESNQIAAICYLCQHKLVDEMVMTAYGIEQDIIKSIKRNNDHISKEELMLKFNEFLG